MPPSTTLIRRRNAVAVATGSINLAVGLTVLVGYALRNPSLVTLFPGSAPMRLTTAIAILCCGVAILLLAAGASRTAAAVAAICGVIGITKLVEAVAGVHLAGFDPVAFAGGAPPRAGALIGILLILASAAMILMAGVVRPRSRLPIVGAIGSMLHSVGVVALVSYIAGVSSAFTEAPYSQLAIHTSIAVAALGAALIRFAWRDSIVAKAGAPAWVPLLVGAATLTTVFCLYAAIDADQEADFAHQVTFEAEELRQFLHAGLDNRTQPLIGMARHRSVVPDLKKEDWDADAQMILSRGGYQAIEWIDPAGRIVWATPPGAGDATPDGNAAFEPRRRAAFDAARQKRELRATRPVDLVTGGKGTVVVVPVFVRDELAGYVAGVFRYQLLFQNLLASNPSPRHSIAVNDGNEQIFSHGSPARYASPVRPMELMVGGVSWNLEVGPTEALVLQAHSPLGGALLVGGGFLAVLLTLLAYLIQKSSSREIADQVTSEHVALTGLSTDLRALAVISYSQDGDAQAWNEIANRLFPAPPPPIARFDTGFRTIQVTMLSATASPDSLDALRLLLDSCAQPALVFDADGLFVAANAAAVQVLGWSDTSWAGRRNGAVFAGGHNGLMIQNVLLMQCRWSVPASATAAAAE